MFNLMLGKVSAMSTRPLRTTAATTPRTLGERIRYARLSIDVSQEQFAKRISENGGGKISKSLVSMWERDDVKNPQNANLIAVQAVTGFRFEWLTTGAEPKRIQIPARASTPSITPINVELLARALATAYPTLADSDSQARIVSGLYELLRDSPDLTPPMLATFAVGLAHSKK